MLGAQVEDLHAGRAHRGQTAFVDEPTQEPQVNQVAEAVVLAAVGVYLGAGVDLLCDLVAHGDAGDGLRPFDLDGIERACRDPVDLTTGVALGRRDFELDGAPGLALVGEPDLHSNGSRLANRLRLGSLQLEAVPVFGSARSSASSMSSARARKAAS